MTTTTNNPSLVRYRVRFRDSDAESTVYTATVKGFNREHAEQMFWDTEEGDTLWEILSITEF